MIKLLVTTFLTLMTTQAFAEKFVKVHVWHQAGFSSMSQITTTDNVPLTSQVRMSLGESHVLQTTVDDSVTAVKLFTKVLAGYDCTVTIPVKRDYNESIVVLTGTQLTPNCELK